MKKINLNSFRAVTALVIVLIFGVSISYAASTIGATVTSDSLTAGADGTDGSLTIYSEQGGTDYSAVFQPHAAMTQTTTYTLPADDGGASEVLSTDGAGALSWAAVFTPALTDNVANALDIQEGANDYINIHTTDGGEEIRFGNATTNPVTNFLGIGGVSIAGVLDANGSVSLGDDGDTVVINSSDWDISTTGDMTGIGAITADGLFTASAGASIGGGGSVVINDAGANWDFRAEGDNDANLLLVEANTDRIGIGIGVPTAKLEVEVADNHNAPGILVDNDDVTNDTEGIQIDMAEGGGAPLLLSPLSAAPTTTDEGSLYYDSDDDNLFVYSNGGWVDLTIQGITSALTDNTTDALDIQEAANNYININTSDGSEDIQFGNATTNPDFSILGSGTTTVAGTLNAGGTVTLGDNGDTVAINSSDWDINVTGDMTGIGAITADGALAVDNAATFNDSGADVDFRVEGDTEANLFFVDGSADRIGIGKNNPTTTLDVTGGITASVAIQGGSLTDGTATITGGALNSISSVNAATENTIEATIFDADAESITGVWEVQDDTNFQFGNDANVWVYYDEAGDDRLEIIGPNADVYIEDDLIINGNSNLGSQVGDTVTIKDILRLVPQPTPAPCIPADEGAIVFSNNNGPVGSLCICPVGGGPWLDPLGAPCGP